MRNHLSWIVIALLCFVFQSSANGQGLAARGTIESGPTPGVISSAAATNTQLTVRNRGAGTFFEIRVTNVPGGHSVTSTSGRQFISGNATRTFNLTINPNGLVGTLGFTVQLLGDSEAGDVDVTETRVLSISSIAPPGAFSILFPEYGTTVGLGTFGFNWGVSNSVENYDLEFFKMVNGLRQLPAFRVQRGFVGNAISFNTNQFERGALYELDIYANNAVGRRLCSNPGLQFAIQGLPTPGAFQVITPGNAAVTSTQPEISWTASTNALSYTVFILPEVNGAPASAPVRTIENVVATSLVLPEPGLARDRTYYVSVQAVAEGGVLLNGNGLVRFYVSPADAVLSDKWYFAEGASFNWLDTYYLVANPNEDTITIDVTFLVESGENRTIPFAVRPKSRLTIRVNDWVQNVGVSGVLVARNARPFAAERAMYTLAPDGRWLGATAVGAIATPSPEWFLAEGATSSAGNGPFQTFVLLANPTDVDLVVDATFFPQGGTPLTFPFNLPAGRRVTIEPANLSPELANRSFSTRVKTQDGTGILVERAMWWTNADLPLGSFVEGNGSAGLPQLSRTWYLAEGNTIDYDQFLLLVNPNNVTATVNLRYLIATAEPQDRTFTLGPNERQTINVRFDQLGLRAANTHGTMIVSSHPIAVERSMYFNLAGGTGWVGGSNTAASPYAAKQWVLPEGAEFPLNENRLRTEILVANPTPETATIIFDFLLDSGTVVSVTRTLQGYRRMTLDTFSEQGLWGSSFSTTILSDVPVVAERTMLFGTETPRSLSRLGATGSFGVPVGELTVQTSLPPTSTTKQGSDATTSAFPTPTPTPLSTPTPIID